MRKRFAMWLLVPVLVCSVILAACAPAAAPPAEKKPATPAPVAEVKIGAMYPLSGAQAPTGLDLKNGVELAAEIINGEYPDLNMPLAKTKGLPNLNNAKLTVVFGDHQAAPEKGMSEAERLYTEAKVVGIVGCYNSGVTATASQVAERLGKPFLNPDSVSPSLITRGFKWFFRLTPDDKMFTENMFKFLEDLATKKNQKVSTIAILNENTLWGQDFAAVAEQMAKAKGYKVVEHIVYPANTSEVTAEVQKLKRANPDVILQASYVSDSILFIKTFKEQNYTPKGLLANAAGAVDVAFVKTLGKDAEYVITRSVWSEDLLKVRPVANTVNELYKKKYGTNMNENSARSFTGTIVLADAINRAKSTDPEAIRKAILETTMSGDQLVLAWDGVKFDPSNGQNTLGRAIMVQIQGGKYITVWPFEVKGADLVWPLPAWTKR
ncbi:MAG: ABC transporter substrate-binding protein [Bacillota bacterium]|nr:ABC transporter substrate-binding protein [Bacillota bacterium]